MGTEGSHWLLRLLAGIVVVTVTAMLAIWVAEWLDVSARGAVLCVYGVLMLLASFAAQSWSKLLRRLGWVVIAEDEVIRQTLRLVGAVLFMIGLLIISFS